VSQHRVEKIRRRLITAFHPEELEISDESHLHVGHEGAKDGKGHFRVRIVADQFAGLKPVQCHRLIYMVVGDLMKTDIHALNIEAVPPTP
jgi:BolA protein